MTEQRVRRLVWILIVLTALLLLSVTSGFAQVRTVTGTRIPGPTWTPTPTPTLTPTSTPTPTITATRTPTRTPDPDPCSECPDPDGYVCGLNYPACIACWEDCGQPFATPTPTPTRTPTAPAPTPTPNGPECILRSPLSSKAVQLVAIYAHESPVFGVRYTFTTPSDLMDPGDVARPCPCEGHPVGFEWYNANTGSLLKVCGDTSRVYPRSPTPTPTPVPDVIFSDGFETGTTARWSSSTP